MLRYRNFIPAAMTPQKNAEHAKKINETQMASSAKRIRSFHVCDCGETKTITVLLK